MHNGRTCITHSLSISFAYNHVSVSMHAGTSYPSTRKCSLKGCKRVKAKTVDEHERDMTRHRNEGAWVNRTMGSERQTPSQPGSSLEARLGEVVSHRNSQRAYSLLTLISASNLNHGLRQKICGLFFLRRTQVHRRTRFYSITASRSSPPPTHRLWRGVVVLQS